MRYSGKISEIMSKFWDHKMKVWAKKSKNAEKSQIWGKKKKKRINQKSQTLKKEISNIFGN